MPRSEQFDVLVLGSGTGGKLVAWHMAQSGRRTAVVERRRVGGSCPNIACMPSKNEISSARVAHVARGGRHYGTLTGSVTVDMATVRQRKREMVDRQIAKHLQIYRTSGAELIMGSGRFLAPKTLEVKLNDGRTRVLSGDKVFLNVGTHAALPDVPGLEAAQPLTHVEALDLDYLPQHLIVIGGGYSGLELAQAYRRFGSHVTVVESGPQIMAREDIDVSREILRILGDEGIEVLVEAKLLQVRGRSGDKVTLTVRARSGEQHIEGSDILVAAGRIPNTAGIGLEEAGVELDRRDYIRVNDRLETSAPEVWALGECAGSRNSRTYPKTIFESYVTISEVEIAPRATGWFHIVCSPILRLPMWAERGRSRTPGCHRSRRQAADGRRAWGAGDRSEGRLYENSCRRQRRPHSWLHDDWRRGRRSHGGGANGNVGRPFLFKPC
jgi:pyruvate/2-oxoglutarate dehydrogenase complex dihydrolipoamide dehydrogenase (E3) component